MNHWTELADAGARAEFAAYFARVDRALAALPQEEANAVRRELEQHALDAAEESGSATGALAQLGDPDDFLPDLVADKLRARAGRTFSPVDVARALGRSAGAGLAGLVLSVLAGAGYVTAALSVVMGVMKLVDPASAGLYRLDDGKLLIGIGNTLGGADVSGPFFAPIAIVAGVVLYVALTWLFGRARLRRRGSRG